MCLNKFFFGSLFALALLLAGCEQEQILLPAPAPIAPKPLAPKVITPKAPRFPVELKNPQIIIIQPKHNEILSTEQSIVLEYSFDVEVEGDYANAYLDGSEIAQLNTPQGRYSLGLTNPGQHTLSIRLHSVERQPKGLDSAVTFISNEQAEIKETSSKLIPTAANPVKRKPKEVDNNPWNRGYKTH